MWRKRKPWFFSRGQICFTHMCTSGKTICGRSAHRYLVDFSWVRSPAIFQDFPFHTRINLGECWNLVATFFRLARLSMKNSFLGLKVSRSFVQYFLAIMFKKRPTCSVKPGACLSHCVPRIPGNWVFLWYRNHRNISAHLWEPASQSETSRMSFFRNFAKSPFAKKSI